MLTFFYSIVLCKLLQRTLGIWRLVLYIINIEGIYLIKVIT